MTYGLTTVIHICGWLHQDCIPLGTFCEHIITLAWLEADLPTLGKFINDHKTSIVSGVNIPTPRVSKANDCSQHNTSL
jgi:hypothetical protein